MHFEILGEIADIETFATGSGIREIARLRRIYGRGRWRKRKELPACSWRMALFVQLKYTGTRPPELGGKSTKSSTCFEI